MISDKYECIYVHVPKTGGTSIENALSDRRVTREWGSEHLTLREYQSADPDRYRRYFKFSVVRNPWDRMLSTYFYIRQGGNGSEPAQQQAAALPSSFSEFCHVALKEGDYEEVLEINLSSQYQWLVDASGDIGVDYYGKLESMQECYETLRRRLNLKRRKVAHVRRSEHPTPLQAYDRETFSIVKDRYADDIAAFDYPDPPWSERLS